MKWLIASAVGVFAVLGGGGAAGARARYLRTSPYV